MSTALVWIRRDLRLTDNPALRAAAEQHTHVVPVYIHAPEEEKSWAPGAASRWWLHHSLSALGDALRTLGAPLCIRHGDSLHELRAVARATGAEAIYWNRLYEPAIVARDGHIKSALREDGFTAESFSAALLFEPWELKTGSGEPYRVFSPFWRTAESRLREQIAQGRSPLPTVRRIAAPSKVPVGVALEALGLLPKIGWDGGIAEHWRPGEAGAKRRLDTFCAHRIGTYRTDRDVPSVEAVSKLSPHLHFGELSPLQVALRIEHHLAEHQAAGIRANAEWFVREIGWREFAHHLMFHFPTTPEEPLHARFKLFPWRRRTDYRSDLAAWQRGRTGIPIVDAGMRQLWHTGWMHNRVRMIVASFLTKNLLIPWQEGAAWFWDTLVDADLANNTLGWQWSAGCGADAAPYFRIFNPLLQGARFDGQGDYVRHWVPELAALPDAALHAPWMAKPGELASAGLKLDQDYPQPLVDLAASRDRALAAYSEIKASAAE